MDFSIRLYEEGLKQLKFRKSLQGNREEITQEHTFKPIINKTAENYKEKFEERLHENLRKKRENLIKLQEKIEENLSFQPKINKKSQEIAFLVKNEEKSFTFKENSREIQEEKWTFQPKILNNSKYQIKSDFFERIEEKNMEKIEKIARIEKEICAENQATFQPKINRNNGFINSRKKSQETIERLYTNVHIFYHFTIFFLIFESQIRKKRLLCRNMKKTSIKCTVSSLN